MEELENRMVAEFTSSEYDNGIVCTCCVCKEPIYFDQTAYQIDDDSFHFECSQDYLDKNFRLKTK